MNNNNKSENEIFPCEYCDAVFEKAHMHRKHMKNHLNETKKEAGARGQREFRCRFCDLPFDKAQALGGHMNRHHDERAKEKLQNVVNMYGIDSVQSLMAQMPEANMQVQSLEAIQRSFEVHMHGQTLEGMQRPFEVNMHGHPNEILINQTLTYPSNIWQPHQQLQQGPSQQLQQGPSPQQQHYAQQASTSGFGQQQRHYAQQPSTSGFGQPQTTIGIDQQMDQGMMSRAPPYSSSPSEVLERQPYHISTHNIGGIGPSNQMPYAWAPGGFEMQRPQSTHTPNFNIPSPQGRHSGGNFEPEPYLLEQDDEGVMSSPTMSQGYMGFKREPRDS